MKGLDLILAPHLYPTSITRNPQETLAENQQRWNLSWGLKMQGADTTSTGAALGKVPVIVGEMGAYDNGDNTKNNTDTTTYSDYDKAWLVRTAAYLKAMTASSGQGLSWFLWCWNANSRDTDGIVGPQTTWREVQWTKIRMLSRELGLRPWYCALHPSFCEQVEWQ